MAVTASEESLGSNTALLTPHFLQLLQGHHSRHEPQSPLKMVAVASSVHSLERLGIPETEDRLPTPNDLLAMPT